MEVTFGRVGFQTVTFRVDEVVEGSWMFWKVLAFYSSPILVEKGLLYMPVEINFDWV